MPHYARHVVLKAGFFALLALLCASKCSATNVTLTDNSPVRFGAFANLSCESDEAVTTWVTPRNLVFHTGNFSNHPLVHTKSLEEVEAPEKYVLENEGRNLLVYNFSRYDVGIYHCVVGTEGNVTNRFHIRLHHENMVALEIESIITGAVVSFGFLVLVLIVQAIRMLVERCNCFKVKKVKKVLKAMESYRNDQMDWVRESYTLQRQRVVDNCAQQMDRIKESYSGQMQSYSDQVKRVRDYSAQQLSWVHEGYVERRRRVQRYTASQISWLRETAKIQQKTLNKIMENIPDINACRTGNEDELDDDDVTVDLRFLDEIVQLEAHLGREEAEEEERFYTPQEGSPERRVVIVEQVPDVDVADEPNEVNA